MAEYRLPAAQKQQRRSPLRVSDGLPIWNSWHSVGQQEFSKDHLKALAPSRADAKVVAAGAPRLASEYQKKAATYDRDAVDASDSWQRQLEALKDSPPRDWHHAAIQYLQIDAAHRDLAKDEDEATTKQRRQSIDRLEQILRFDQDRSGDLPARYNSPAKFDPDQFQRSASDLHDTQPAINSNN
jgi:hypothetical protein